MSEWTDELRQQVVKRYLESDPTPENSVEIVKEIAEEFEKTPNGVRMVLTRENVYVKKDTTSSSSSKSSTEKSTSTRVSKAAAMESLNNAIKSAGLEPNDEIISKLTGKAAVYFAEVINSLA